MATKNTPAKAKGTSVVSWEEKLSRYAQQAVTQEESVQTGNFISFRAGVMTYQGNPIAGNKLECVTVDSILENRFYSTPFDEDNPSPPDCYAFGRDDKEMKPHEKAANPQAESCKKCPHNQFGSADKGKGKACANIRRIALLPAKPLSKEALEKSNFAIARIPVTSVANWASYVRTLSGLQKRPPMAVVTEMQASPDTKTVFKVTFNHLLNLKNDLLEVVDARMQEAEDTLMSPYPEPSDEPAPKAKGKQQPAKKRKY